LSVQAIHERVEAPENPRTGTVREALKGKHCKSARLCSHTCTPCPDIDRWTAC
jgi:hypothetical protein